MGKMVVTTVTGLLSAKPVQGTRPISSIRESINARIFFIVLFPPVSIRLTLFLGMKKQEPQNAADALRAYGSL